MDTGAITMMMMSKFASGGTINIFEIILCVFLLPFIGTLVKEINFSSMKGYYDKYFVKEKMLIITGYTISINENTYNSFCTLFKSVSEHLIENNNIKCSTFEIFCKKKILSLDSCPKTSGALFDFSVEKKKSNCNAARTDIFITLYSNKIDLVKLVGQIEKDYIKKQANKTKNILYHFIFESYDAVTDKLHFSVNKLSLKTSTNNNDDDMGVDSNDDFEESVETLNETFEHLFHEHVTTIKNDIIQLRDKKYYSDRGIKRKKGYIFHGLPGNGKSSTLTAMALFDNRHIIEIPFLRVKSEKALERIMNLKKIDDISFKKEEIILLFDEIDIGNDILKERDFEIIDKKDSLEYAKIIGELSDAKKKLHDNNNDNKVSLGTMLSRLDGVGNYNGIIFVATTNCIEKLDKSLCRDLRLTPFKFDNARQEDIAKMLEKYCKTVLTDEDKNKIPDGVLCFSKVRNIICCNDENLSLILDDLKIFIQKD